MRASRVVQGRLTGPDRGRGDRKVDRPCGWRSDGGVACFSRNTLGQFGAFFAFLGLGVALVGSEFLFE